MGAAETYKVDSNTGTPKAFRRGRSPARFPVCRSFPAVSPFLPRLHPFLHLAAETAKFTRGAGQTYGAALPGHPRP